MEKSRQMGKITQERNYAAKHLQELTRWSFDKGDHYSVKFLKSKFPDYIKYGKSNHSYYAYDTRGDSAPHSPTETASSVGTSDASYAYSVILAVYVKQGVIKL